MCLAVPGQVESIRDENGMRMGRVNFGGVVKDVCLAYLPDIAVGDYTIVHVGFAISKIDEASARETLAHVRELGLLEEGLARTPRPGAGGRRDGAMKHLAEYRDADTARRLAGEIRRIATRPWAIMEVCGGQTHSIIRNGIDQLLPPEVELIHGPGCPVCVTPLEMIDRALAIAARPGVIFCSFGDMLRVPGIARGPVLREGRRGRRPRRLLAARRGEARAAASRPRGRVLRHRLRDHRAGQRDGGEARQASRGCETSRCSSRTCSCRRRSRRSCGRPGNRVQGVPRRRARLQRDGHLAVSARSRHRFGVPIVVTGFEPLDLLEGIRRAVRAAGGRDAPRWRTPIPRVVSERGNEAAQARDRGGLRAGRPGLAWHRRDPGAAAGGSSDAYREFDAEDRFAVAGITAVRVAALPERRGAQGHAQAQPVPGLRQGVHAADAARAPRWCRARAPARPTTTRTLARRLARPGCRHGAGRLHSHHVPRRPGRRVRRRRGRGLRLWPGPAAERGRAARARGARGPLRTVARRPMSRRWRCSPRSASWCCSSRWGSSSRCRGSS